MPVCMCTHAFTQTHSHKFQVNNVGIAFLGLEDAMDPIENFDEVMAVNLRR